MLFTNVDNTRAIIIFRALLEFTYIQVVGILDHERYHFRRNFFLVKWYICKKH